jgi:hypothetical protein
MNFNIRFPFQQEHFLCAYTHMQTKTQTQTQTQTQKVFSTEAGTVETPLATHGLCAIGRGNPEKLSEVLYCCYASWVDGSWKHERNHSHQCQHWSKVITSALIQGHHVSIDPRSSCQHWSKVIMSALIQGQHVSIDPSYFMALKPKCWTQTKNILSCRYWKCWTRENHACMYVRMYMGMYVCMHAYVCI